MHKSKLIAMIPARIGSQRLKFKNFALVNGKPLISYAIKNSIKSKIFDKIVLNSDSELFKSISKEYKVDFYLRNKKLGGPLVRSDDVVFDFLNKYHNYDYLFWINPISPLTPRSIGVVCAIKLFSQTNKIGQFQSEDRFNVS